MSENDIDNPQRIAIGIIRKSIGFKGFSAVQALGTTLSKVKVPVEVFIGANDSVVTPYTLELIEFKPKGPVCRFSGMESAEEVDVLRDNYIYIDAELLPKLGNGEYYHFDLIGLKVRDDRGNELGSVVNVHNFPSVDCIEVKRGSSADTLMIPLTAEAVVEVDQLSGYLTVCNSFIEELL